jgi:hypothetical protein
MPNHPMRAFAWGDLSSNPRGRSGDIEIGADLDHRELGTVYVRLTQAGRLEVRHRPLHPETEETALLTVDIAVDQSIVVRGGSAYDEGVTAGLDAVQTTGADYTPDALDEARDSLGLDDDNRPVNA